MKRLGKWLAIYVAVAFAAPWLALLALTPDQIEQGYLRLTLVAIPSAVVLDGMIAVGVFALVLRRVGHGLAISDFPSALFPTRTVIAKGTKRRFMGTHQPVALGIEVDINATLPQPPASP